MPSDLNHKKPALVLSGGGLKAAAFHLGVCIALQECGFRFAGGTPKEVKKNFPENEMTFKTYVGSSAGAFMAAFLASGYDTSDIIYNFFKNEKHSFSAFLKNIQKDKKHKDIKPLSYRDLFAVNLEGTHPSRFLPDFFKKKPSIRGGLEVLLKKMFKINGVFSAKNLERYLRNHIKDTNTFDSLGVDLHVIATELNEMRKVVFNRLDKESHSSEVKYTSHAKISEAVAASACLPPVYAPYGIENEKKKKVYYFDGEIRDTLSTHLAVEQGADLIISSYSIQPYSYHKEMGSLHDYGIPMIFNQAIYQVVQQKIESYIEKNKRIGSLLKDIDSMKEFSLEQKKSLRKMILKHTKHNPNIEYIYIHPGPDDFKMFFYDHFSLNAQLGDKISKVGYKAAIRTLRPYLNHQKRKPKKVSLA